MAKYLIVKADETKTSTGKSMWKATLKDEEGNDHNRNLFDKVAEGMTVEGEVYVNEKGYTNFRSTAKAAKSDFVSRQKSEEIKKTAFEIQQNISQNIAKAQDRTAWMWAKTNASTLIANHPNFTWGENAEGLANQVIRLATLIYNGEPTEPFSSPSERRTSPSEDYPNGIKIEGHPFISDEELNNIPF